LKNRHGRFRDSDLLRRLFEAVLRRCIDEGLVGGEGFAVDASLIKADANRQKGFEGGKGLPPQAASRAVDEYLAVLDDAAFGAATEIVPKFISPAHPVARWIGAHGGQAFFAYSTKSDRCEECDHCRCGTNHSDSAGGSSRRQAHDRADGKGTSRSNRPGSSVIAPMVQPTC
jgi:hypothetical protein